ncbi:hypothetical protein BDZ89DRAFT_1126625 [Hymenopellis radicata]|nr:hypothetical protein BDZ89DRAFT_1126625 [Hymenopellis radicata]
MKLIAVDLSTKLWFYILVDSRMRPRNHASIVTVDQRLYVFGGQDKCGNELSTYCIADCIDCRWRWIVLERSYPSRVSSLGCNGAATLVQGAAKILLASTSLEFVRRVVIFDVASEEFEIVSETVGGSWSHVYASTSLPPTIPTLRKRSVLPVPTIVICGQPASREEGGSLELWRYLLPPYNDLRRLNVNEQVRDMDLEMPFFVSVAGRHFLCGSQVLANVPHYDACIEVDVQRALDIQVCLRSRVTS